MKHISHYHGFDSFNEQDRKECKDDFDQIYSPYTQAVLKKAIAKHFMVELLKIMSEDTKEG